MAKGGSLFSAAAEPPPKQARTPTRRKLDMLASDDAASAREDDAVDEAVENAQLECATRAGTDVFANQNRPGVRLATERERVWRLLLGNVVRAVDEVYLLCEMECGAPEIEGTTSLLEACAADFKNLLIRVGDQEKFLAEREASRDKNADDASREAQALVSQQKTSISWDVGRVAARPSDASRDMIRAVVDADKDADKDAAAGGWRPARGKRGERRRERDAGRARRRERRRSKTEDEIEKNDSDEAVLGQTSREDKREDKLRIADRTRTRAFTPGSKPDRASRPPRPAANARASNAATENKKPPVGTRDSAIPDDAQKRTDSRVDSVESLGSLSGKLAASGASASSFGSWADSDDDDALFHETPFPRARAPILQTKYESAPSPPPAVWGAKRDWGAILAPAGAAMHAKLMSPDRKKKTPGETAALLLERQARATEARARAESERAERASRLRNGGDPAKPRPTAAEKETRAARAAERAAEQLEARHRRAEETREARIANLVKKASEETRKIEEIALLHSLDTANKKAALREKLAEAEKRRASVAEARRVAAEAAEGAARAAEERRVAEETRKRLRVEERVREKELRRDALAREAAAREAALTERRDEEAAEKLAEREARERRAKTEADERRAETRRRLLAADARRRAYLNLVRERAVESSTPGRAGGEKERETPEKEKPASPSRLRGDAFASTPAGDAALESPSRPSRAVAGEALERRVAAVADRHRAMRKRAKKLRQRLAAAAGPVVWRRGAGPTEPPPENDRASEEPPKSAEKCEKEEKSWSSLPEHADSASPRLRKLAVAVARRDPEKCLNAHREMRTALAEAGAAAAAAGAEEHGAARGLAPGAAAAAAALAGAVTSGLVRAVAEALAECLAASAQGGGFVDSPDAAVTCVSLAVALDAATAGSPLAAEALLLENLAAPLVPHLVAGLGLVGDPAAAEAATPGAGGGVPPPTAALEPLLAVVTRVVNGPRAYVESFRNDSIESSASSAKKEKISGGVSLFALFPPCARYARSRDDFAQLLVASGAVDALASLFALCDRPKEQSVEPVPPAIVAGLRLLESLLTSAPPPSVGSGVDAGAVGIEPKTNFATTERNGDAFVTNKNDWRNEGQGSLIVALRATALAGLPSLLTSVLLQTENETRAPVLADPRVTAAHLPANFVSVATVVMRLLNAIHAAFGCEAVQQVLSSSDLRVETHHLLSVSLAVCCGEWDRASSSAKSAERSGKSVERVERVERRDRRANEDPHSSLVSRWTLDALAELLDETLLFIGAFALLCPANQDMLRWGHAPTLAQRLPDLPFAYYAEARKKAALFPTLVAVAFRHPTNRAAIARDLSLDTVRAFVEGEMEREKMGNRSREEPDGSVAEDDVGSRDPKQKNARSRVSSAAAAGLPARFDFAARFPPELWEDAATYFSSSDA